MWEMKCGSHMTYVNDLRCSSSLSNVSTGGLIGPSGVVAYKQKSADNRGYLSLIQK